MLVGFSFPCNGWTWIKCFAIKSCIVKSFGSSVSNSTNLTGRLPTSLSISLRTFTKSDKFTLVDFSVFTFSLSYSLRYLSKVSRDHGVIIFLQSHYYPNFPLLIVLRFSYLFFLIFNGVYKTVPNYLGLLQHHL